MARLRLFKSLCDLIVGLRKGKWQKMKAGINMSLGFAQDSDFIL